MDREIYEIKELYSLTNLEAEILHLLLQNPKGLTAKEVIKAFPNRGKNMYRPLEKLVKLGIVERTNQWPRVYSTQNFEKEFSKLIKSKSIPKQYSLLKKNIFKSSIKKIQKAIKNILRL
jgi:Fe2+ or Zn2+ uptake regulation protein